MTQKLNATTPAPPSGAANVHFRSDHGAPDELISAHVLPATITVPGLIQLAPGADVTKFLRGDGTWAAPPSGGGGGSSDFVEDISGWVYTNFTDTGSTATQTGGGGNPVLVKVVNYPGLNWVWATRPFGAASFTATLKFRCMFWGANSQTFGLYLDGDGTLAISVELLVQGPGSGATFRVQTLNSPTSSGSTRSPTLQIAMSLYDSGDLWVRVKYNLASSGNMVFEVSFDGVNWIPMLTEAIGSFITPTRVGFGGVSVGVAQQMWATVKSFSTV